MPCQRIRSITYGRKSPQALARLRLGMCQKRALNPYKPYRCRTSPNGCMGALGVAFAKPKPSIPKIDPLALAILASNMKPNMKPKKRARTARKPRYGLPPFLPFRAGMRR